MIMNDKYYITPEARRSMEVTKAIKVFKAFCNSKNYLDSQGIVDTIIAWISNEAHPLAREYLQKSMQTIISASIDKVKRQHPQYFNDFIEIVFKYRIYHNIYDKNVVCYGFPPKHLGGEGLYWSFFCLESEIGYKLSRMVIPDAPVKTDEIS
jgi:hypothetical protein